MNIDGIESTSNLEVSAYFQRNQNIVCRPYRNRVLKSLEKKELKLYKPLLSFLAFLEVPINKKEWEREIGDILENLCQSSIKMDRMGWMQKTKRRETTKSNLFDLLDGNGDG